MRSFEVTFVLGVRVDVVGERVLPDFSIIKTFSPFIVVFICQLSSHELALTKLARWTNLAMLSLLLNLLCSC